jgi:hypothetical protein
MKTYVGEEVYLHAFLTSALDSGGWSASGPNFFTRDDGASDNYSIGDRVGPKTGLLGKEISLYLLEMESL